MDRRAAEALRWWCRACDALVDETHPRLYRGADESLAHTYAGPNGLGVPSPGLARLLPVDDGTARSPLDVPAVAALLGVRVGTVHKWQTRGVGPAEDGRVSDRPYWWPTTIERWATGARRWQGYVTD